MKLNGLIELALILTLAFCSEGHGDWKISVDRHVFAVMGSDVTINCTFTCPPDKCQGPVAVYWKKNEKSTIKIKDKDKNPFILHNDKNYVLEKYRGKTELVPNRGIRDCSLKIRNVTENHKWLYVRINTTSEMYSFYKYVSITVTDKNDTLTKTYPPITDDSLENSSSLPPTQPPLSQESSMNILIFVPLALVVIFVTMAGVFFLIKRKRTQSVTREGSGYYANFSRASSNNPKSEVSCKKIDELPALTDVEDPIYVNVKRTVDQTDGSVDHTNNIYANVDYTR